MKAIWSILTSLFVFTYLTVNGQSTVFDKKEEKLKLKEDSLSTTLNKTTSDVEAGKLYVAPLPILASSPAFGFMYGAAASGSIFLGDPSSTNMSNALVTGAYTTKNQLLFTLKSTLYTNENKWMLQGDYRLFFSSQPTFGLGTGAEGNTLQPGISPYGLEQHLGSEQAMDFDLIRFYQTALRQVQPGFYLGLGVHFDRYSNIKDHLLDLEGEKPAYTHHYIYNTKYGFDPNGYTIAGVSANAVYDTRDNIANPYTGRLLNAQFRYNADFLGSDQSSSSLWLEYRDYFNVNKDVPRNLIAVWTYANVTTHGKLPYMAMPAMGWDHMGKSGRGYPQGRWRGDNLFYAEAEYRFRLPLSATRPDLFGGVVFVNATTASSYDNQTKLFEHWQPAAGIGLRIQIQKKTRTNLSIDYGWGPNGAGGLFLNLTEYF